MQLTPRTNRFSVCSFIVSLLLTSTVLFSSLMAVSPSLHQLLHQDANQSSHECVVTMLQKQQVCGEAPSPLLVAVTETISFSPQVGPTISLAQVDHCLPSSRGPPVILL